MAAPVTITFLGGLGEIGRNCAVLELEGQLLLLDCGLMFPDARHARRRPRPARLHLAARERATASIGCIATHGHEDHVGGLSYLLRELSFPIYGSALTLGLARNRIEEAGLLGNTELIAVDDGERRKIGPFDVEFIPVTHSVPHGFATAFHTPQGVIMHTGDLKLDLTPVDGRLTDLARIGAIAVRRRASACCWRDSTNADAATATPARETCVGAVLYDLFHEHEGRRIIIACFASHVHRVQQIADAAIAFGRKVATARPVDEEEHARWPGRWACCTSRTSSIIDIEDIDNCPTGKVCVISTGSQGEPMSALTRMANSENRWLTHRRRRHGDPVLAPDPGQRDERDAR